MKVVREILHEDRMYRAALYMRLSKDDDGIAESASIAAQRKMLRAYATENGYQITGEYADDGYSGTSFDRPDFKRMLGDIETGKVNMVITKDFSRLGRDYIAAGQYTELYFPERGVRYIAVNDGYDSSGSANDIAPFKHVVNEMYARDLSRKIRSALGTKMREGGYIGNFAPYGYKKDSNDKNRLVIDQESAAMVREIFRLAADGFRPSEIARRLNQNGISSPAVYRCDTYPHLDAFVYTKRGEWTSATICKMLANIVYLGHMAQGKTSKPSLKSKAAVRKQPAEWHLVKNTHEPLVTHDIFDLVRKRSVSRRNPPKTGFSNIFAGVAKCADCGANMSVTGSRRKNSPYSLVCGRYKLYGKAECTNHFIDYKLLYGAVLSELREKLILSDKEKQQVYDSIEKAKSIKKRGGAQRETAAFLTRLKSRDKELDGLIRQLYEDNVNGKISDGRFIKLCAAYEAEQQETMQKIQIFEEHCDVETGTKEPLPCLSEIIDSLAELQELTPNIIKQIIERIEISQGVYEPAQEGIEKKKNKRQTVRIIWCFEDKNSGMI